MTSLADKAKEYRLRAQHLREAAARLRDSELRDQALALANEWIILAQGTEARLQHIHVLGEPQANQDSVVIELGQLPRK